MTLADYAAKARELLAAAKKGDHAALRRFRTYLPTAYSWSPIMAKYVIAREAGFTGWPALRQHLAKTSNA